MSDLVVEFSDRDLRFFSSLALTNIAWSYAHWLKVNVCVYICACIDIYVCVCVCVCMYVYSLVIRTLAQAECVCVYMCMY